MLLAIDIGNTHIVTGILDKNGEVLLTFRVASNDKLTEDEYFSYLRNISEFNNCIAFSTNFKCERPIQLFAFSGTCPVGVRKILKLNRRTESPAWWMI